MMRQLPSVDLRRCLPGFAYNLRRSLPSGWYVTVDVSVSFYTRQNPAWMHQNLRALGLPTTRTTFHRESDSWMAR